jgi:Domain of unknown function (DUF4293)
MLQRIQSIYLLLASLAIFALFLFPLAHNVYVDNKPISIMVTGTYADVNGQQAPATHFVALSAVTAVVGIIPLIVIFLYKNRKQQVTLCYSTILVIIGYSFWIAQTAKSVTGGVTLQAGNFGIGLFLCPLSILLLILAVKGIQRDEKLIKSANRLR